MFEITAAIILAAASLILYRLVKGPTVFDRVLSVNLIGTKTVLILAVTGFVYERPHFLDIALVYALMNFIATIAFLKYCETGRLG